MQSLASITAERVFRQACAEKYLKVSLDRRLVCQVARTLPKQRRVKAMAGLLEEYGRQEAIPTGELIDKLFGIDALYKVHEMVIGVDVTLDESRITEKRQKLSSLSEAHRALGIDRTVVFCPNIHKDLQSAL